MSGDQHTNEDILLQSLGEMARAEEQLDGDLAQLERLLQGDLPAAEQRELERRASADPELARGLEAYRPLDQTAQQRIAERILESLPQPQQQQQAASTAATTTATATTATATTATATTADGDPGSDTAAVVDIASRPRRRPRRRSFNLGWLAMPLAAAAALLLWFGGPVTSPEALPDYGLSASGGQRELRGTQQVSQIDLAPDATLTLTLRPATAVEGKVAAQAFLVVEAERVRPLAFDVQLSAAGAVRLSGSASALFGEARGSREVRVIIGRAEIVEDSARQLARGHQDAGAGWQRLTLRLRLLDAPR